MSEKYSRSDWKDFLDFPDGGKIMINHTERSFAYKGTGDEPMRNLTVKERLFLKMAEIGKETKPLFNNATARYEM